jgi:acyl-CoA synthetase (AMP-forming)/AMP-acid ligase II
LNGLGVSVVPINPDWRSAELEYLLDHSEIAVAASLPERADDLRKAAAAVDRTLIVTGPDATDLPRASVPPSPRRNAPNTDTECALLYTSGTTGRPKGCVLSNEYFLWAGQWYAQLGGLCEVRPGVDRMITPLPLTHMNAFACSAMCMLLTGVCLVLLDRFHPGTWWRSVRDSRATIVHYLGVMPAMLLSAPESPDDRRHDVRFGFGAGVNPRITHCSNSVSAFRWLGVGDDGNRRRCGRDRVNREPRHVGTACFGRAEPRSNVASSTMQAATSPSARLANCSSGAPDRTHGSVSFASTSRTPKRPRQHGRAAGFTRATWSRATPAASFASSIARRT